jgi:hypothetical protein
LERGDLSGVSEGVLEALAGALKLDDAEETVRPSVCEVGAAW